MASHKRKSDDMFETNRSFADAGKESEDAVSRRVLDQLKTMRKGLETDPVLDQMQNMRDNDEDPVDDMLNKAEDIHRQLATAFASAKAACQHESGVLQDIASKINIMNDKRRSLLDSIDALDQQQVKLQQKIAQHQLECEEELERIDGVQEARKAEVPRLKHQLSLYAATTGIKWDFSDENQENNADGAVLTGSVVRGSLGGFLLLLVCTFSSDLLDTGYARSKRTQTLLN